MFSFRSGRQYAMPRIMSAPVRVPQLLPVRDIPATKELAARKRGSFFSSKMSR
jgi:hypothetical protein